MKYLVSILFLVSGIGSLITGIHPILGGVLSALGIVVTIWTYIQSDAAERNSAAQIELMTLLLAEKGIGNLYLEQFKRDSSGGHLKTTEGLRRLEKALIAEPHNCEVLGTLSLVYALLLAFYHWAGQDVLKAPLSVWFRRTRELADLGLRLEPDNHVFWDVQGILHDLVKNHPEAQRFFITSSTKRKDPYWRLLLATSLGMAGDARAALEEIKRAKEEGAIGWLADFYLGRALLDSGYVEEAWGSLNVALKIRGWRPELLSYLSKAANLRGHFVLAARYEVMEAIALAPLVPRACFALSGAALMHLSLGIALGLSSVIWLITKHIPIVRDIHLRISPPDEPEASLVFAILRTGNYLAALDYFQRAFDRLPSPKNTANLAGCLAKLERTRDAMAVCADGLRRFPGNIMIDKMNHQIESGISFAKGRALKLNEKGEVLEILKEEE